MEGRRRRKRIPNDRNIFPRDNLVIIVYHFAVIAVTGYARNGISEQMT